MVPSLFLIVFAGVLTAGVAFRKSSWSATSISKSPTKTSLLPNEIDLTLYDMQLQFSSILSRDLGTLSPLSVAVLGAAGTLSAMSPCSLGLLPISVSYLSKSNPSGLSDTAVSVSLQDKERTPTVPASDMKTVSYVLGVLAAFAGLGATSSVIGTLLGSSLDGYGYVKDLFIASLYIIMGLSLSEVVPINFSQLIKTEALTKSAGQYSEGVQAFAFGASSALVGSSCTTPVLSSVLALIAAKGDPSLGAVFLVVYGLGFTVPLLSAKYIAREVSFSQLGGRLQWINQFFASALLMYGGYLGSNLLFSLAE